MKKRLKVIIEAASLTVNLSQNTMVMAPYSSQYITMTVSPASAYYRVYWASSDTRVVSVSGSNATTVINSVGPGTATVYAIVTDVNGIEIRRGCTVLVEDASSVYNPSVATTLGIPYVGTGTSTAMSSQFQALYGMALADNAVIRFTSTGNNDVGILRLADGSAAKADVDYTFAQYVSMYTEPVSAGTYSFPYYLTYGGKSLNGTVNVIINPASIRTDITLPVKTTFNFSESIDGNTGALILLNSISNTVGSKWGFIRFNSVSSDTGTLYLDRNLTPIKIGANVLPTALDQLHFVPTALNGAFTASYSVFNAAGALLGNGTLNISEPGVSFADVPADAYYAQAVKWAVERGITSGTGGNSFSPDMSVTRGQAVTFLWRAAGQPKSTIAVNPFTDVIAGAYYYDAVLWAVQQGITNGTSDTAFSPDLQLNRDQLLTFLCRANGGYAGGLIGIMYNGATATNCYNAGAVTGGSGKMGLLSDLITEYLEQGHRILIFSQFVKALEAVEAMLAKKSIPVYFLSGSTPAQDRMDMMDSFNNGSGTDVFLISLKAGGTGLNLTGADTVIHLDPWWNVAAENQASDRTHRIGQTKNVEVIKLIAEGSIEQRVVELQDIKKEVIRQVISDDDGSVTSAKLEDIAFVLS